MKHLKSLVNIALLCSACTFSLAVRAQAQTYTTLAEFDGSNGSSPAGSLTQATDGNFYGVTRFGGAFNEGSVFRVTPDGKITSIYSFCSQTNCTDGAAPLSGPILASDGNLYGITRGGGASNSAGTFYRITLDGALTTLYTFCTTSGCPDGAVPNGIIQAADGNFYGTAPIGGKANLGTFFRITPSGEFSTLYSFCSWNNCRDGSSPYAPPIQGSNGSFYGTTVLGGVGAGLVYELTPGKGYQVLEKFCYGALQVCPFGSEPTASLVQDAAGNLFGTTAFGGTYDSGTVFEIPAKGEALVVHAFHLKDWVDPSTGLILASDGNLYGVGLNNDWDNLNGYGTIFEITSANAYSVLSSNYQSLNGPVVQGTDGDFYGTTVYSKSSSDHGTVFKLSNGLSPFVRTIPAVAKAGETVLVLGNHLIGTTGVMFNGVQADFTVESDTYIKATVPAGATSGVVSVVTPSGMLSSNPRFVVTK